MSKFSTKLDGEKLLSMPLNPVYISTARTTASSIAEKMNFSNSKVEDIKMAVSETVSFLIKNTSQRTEDSQIQIKFIPINNNNDLKVEFKSPTYKKVVDTASSLNVIRCCMDDVNIDDNSADSFSINMIKKCK